MLYLYQFNCGIPIKFRDTFFDSKIEYVAKIVHFQKFSGVELRIYKITHTDYTYNLTYLTQLTKPN